jgi:hypothetical protein
MSSSTIWERVFDDLVVEGGEVQNFELRVPHRGTITKLILSQEAGVAAGCELDLFNSRLAAPPDQGSSSSEGLAGNIALYQVFATKSLGSGEVLLQDFAIAANYCNRDGTSTNPERRLYLQLRPGGTGTKVFALALAIEPPQL